MKDAKLNGVQPSFYQEEEEEDFNIQDYVRRYLRYWYFFPIFLALALISAFFYLQITPPVYSAKTSILIKD